VTLALAIGYLLVAFATVVTHNHPWLFEPGANWLHAMLLPLDKTNLDPLRFVHILAYVVLVARFVPSDWIGFQSALARPVILCGRNSLEIFCLGVFLAFTAHFLIMELRGQIITQLVVSLAGIALMIAVANWIELLHRAGREPGRKTNSDIAGGFA